MYSRGSETLSVSRLLLHAGKNCRRRRHRLYDRPARYLAKIFLDQRACAIEVDVTGNDQAGVVGRVVLLEELDDVRVAGGGEIFHVTDRRPAIRVCRRPQHLVQLDRRHAVRPVLVALSALVLHDVALAVDALRRHRVEKVAHAIRLEEQRQFQRVGGHVDDVIRPIVRGRSVVVTARAFEQEIELPFGHVLRSFEHQVLEQVRETGAPGLLVRRSDVVPEVDRHHRDARIAMQDHIQPVGELELLEGNLKGSWRLRTQRNGQQGEQDQQNAATHAASLRLGSIVLHFRRPPHQPQPGSCDEPNANHQHPVTDPRHNPPRTGGSYVAFLLGCCRCARRCCTGTGSAARRVSIVSLARLRLLPVAHPADLHDEA